MEILSDLGEELARLADVKTLWQCRSRIEAICERILGELQRQNLTGLNDRFLASHGGEIMNTIEDAQIRSLPVLFG